MPPLGLDRPCIALIAHDAKKDAMVAFVGAHADCLRSCRLIATGTTGTRIAEGTGLKVERFLSGPLGGDAQIGALVVGKSRACASSSTRCPRIHTSLMSSRCSDCATCTTSPSRRT